MGGRTGSKYPVEGGFTIQHKIIKRALSLPSQQRIISLPHALVIDTSIDPRAKALYLSLIAHKPSSIRELATCTSLSRNLVTKLIHSLVKTGWVVIYETPCKKIMIPTQPPEIQKANLDYVRASDKMSPRSGENKMNLMLDLIVDVSPCIHNACPWFLQNPKSKEFLEYDRFDPEAMRAWEFDGRQHYEVTPDFPDKNNLKQIQARDKLKARLSRENGVALITITAEDLTVENMLSKIPEDVPIKLIDVNGIYAKGLEQMCLQYIAYYERARARDERFHKLGRI